MSVVAANHIFVCALFLVQGGMWTGYSQSTYLPALGCGGKCTDLRNLTRVKCISFQTIDTSTNSESEKWKW